MTKTRLRVDGYQPYFSIAVLECTAADLDHSFGTLRAFLHKVAVDPG